MLLAYIICLLMLDMLLKSSGQPNDELPPEASKLQAVRMLLIAALS
jgi:hypothetical protein